MQNLTGQNAVVQQASGEQQRMLGIALELQADCYAGAWAYDAARRTDEETGLPLFEEGEIREAINAAQAVGDDRIQQRTQGRVIEEQWTHGSAEQRESWFRRGYETGDPAQCDTFAAEVWAAAIVAAWAWVEHFGLGPAERAYRRVGA